MKLYEEGDISTILVVLTRLRLCQQVMQKKRAVIFGMAFEILDGVFGILDGRFDNLDVFVDILDG